MNQLCPSSDLGNASYLVGLLQLSTAALVVFALNCRLLPSVLTIEIASHYCTSIAGIPPFQHRQHPISLCALYQRSKNNAAAPSTHFKHS